MLYNNHHFIQHAVLVYLNAAKYFSNIFLLPALASPCAILGKSDYLADFFSLGLPLISHGKTPGLHALLCPSASCRSGEEMKLPAGKVHT